MDVNKGGAGSRVGIVEGGVTAGALGSGAEAVNCLSVGSSDMAPEEARQTLQLGITSPGWQCPSAALPLSDLGAWYTV